MATKLEGLPGEQYEALIADLRAIAGKPTLKQIQDVAKKYGVSISTDSAWRFRDGPYARAMERLNASRETREALCAAAGAGVHPLDAIEEAAVIALQEHLAEAESINIKFVVDQLTKLRASISLREDSRRKQADLERKIADSEAARQQNERRTQILEERLELLQFDAASAALEHAQELRAIAGDGSLNTAEKLERARLRLFGEAPAGTKTLREIDEQRRKHTT